MRSQLVNPNRPSILEDVMKKNTENEFWGRRREDGRESHFPILVISKCGEKSEG